MKIDVLSLGELLADIISEEYVDGLKEAKSFKMFQGGSPANVCANLRWLGIQTEMVSCVGDDGIGQFLIEAIKKIGLSDQYIKRSKTHPTTLVLVGRNKGTPDFVAYRMADAQISQIEDDLINRSSILHTCAFALSKNPAQKNILDAFKRGAKKGKLVSVDWNFASKLWDTDGVAVFKKLCSMKPLLKFSLDDVERFTGKMLSAEEGKNFLSAFDSTATCLTCGKDGVWFRGIENPEWQFKPASPVKEVVDVTGAGDAFWAGFLSGFVKKRVIEDCVADGLNVAALKVQKLGPLYL